MLQAIHHINFHHDFKKSKDLDLNRANLLWPASKDFTFKASKMNAFDMRQF